MSEIREKVYNICKNLIDNPVKYVRKTELRDFMLNENSIIYITTRKYLVDNNILTNDEVELYNCEKRNQIKIGKKDEKIFLQKSQIKNFLSAKTVKNGVDIDVSHTVEFDNATLERNNNR